MNTFLIVDDHLIVHEGLKNILEQNFPVKKITHSYSSSDAFNLVKNDKYDLVFIDISMDNSNIFNSIKEIKDISNNTKIIVYSMQDGKTFAFRTIKAGADGYLEKKQPKTDIIFAIKKVLSGQKYMSEEVYYSNLSQVDSNYNKNKLSNQEMIVAQYLCEGLTNKKIGSILNLNSSTISTLKRRIFDKLDINNVIDLVDVFEPIG